VPYALQNALFNWEEGERRLREADEPERTRLERASGAVLDELRRRLGSTFSLEELAEHYAADTDWGLDVATRHLGGADPSSAVDAAFLRYSREAADYAGRRHPTA
jgi:hypothetical protein